MTASFLIQFSLVAFSLGQDARSASVDIRFEAETGTTSNIALSMSKLIDRIRKDESGAAMLEYVIITALITAVCIGIIVHTSVKLSSITDLISQATSNAAKRAEP